MHLGPIWQCIALTVAEAWRLKHSFCCVHPMQLCQLSSLTLECPPTVERDEFFSCIALAESITHLTTLRYLSMTDLWLEALPPGPYLASLRTLLLPGNCLALVPPALADARRLEVRQA